MQKTDILVSGRFALSARMFAVSVQMLGVTPALAAPLDPGLKLAAVAPSQETEKQRETRLIEGAKKEGKVVIWDAGAAREWEEAFNKFRQRYPFVVVEHWRGDDAAIHQKITTEARAGVYNVDVASTEINVIAELKKTGLMKKYSWPNAVAWSPQYKDRDGYWIARHILCVVTGYNTNLVSPSEAPKSWDDVLQPKWKGVISMERDAGDWVLMLWAEWGKEKTLSYLKNLAKNNIVLGAGSTARNEMLAAGAFKIDLRLNLNRFLEYQQKGAPIDWVRTDPILSRSSPIFIAERSPHPNAAMLFADWFTSLEGQQAYSDASGRLLPDPRIKSRVGEALKGLRIASFPAEMAVHGKEADAIWRDIFLK
jgi:iron(III) transport system substrate-binding protein